MKIDGQFVIDTNILVYSLNKNSIFFRYSRELITNNPGSLCLACKSVSEFVCVMSKMGLYEIVEKELGKILSKFTILYSDSLSEELFRHLVLKYRPVGNRVYDFEIVSVMLAHGITKIATINDSDFKDIEEIEIISHL